jgi:hypothetical protein
MAVSSSPTTNLLLVAGDDASSARALSGSRLDEAGVVGEHDGLHSIAQP